MAYTSAYDYDIFISYAHDDNDALSAESGWVTQFHEYLDNWLVKRRHLKGLKIWFDTELKGNTIFDQAIQGTITKSALFFVLHSGNYQNSEYCRKELGWFLEQNSKLPNGVMIGNESRIFNILIENIHHDDWPEDLSGTSGFPLHDASGKDDFGYPTSAKSEQFNVQMRNLIEAIAGILNKIPKSISNASIETTDNRPKIFIADTSDSQQIFRKRLINEFGDNAIILPALPPPYEAKEHQQSLQQSLDESSLSIHLLDQWPGRQVDGLEEDLSFPRIQADTATSTQQPSLIWVPDSLSPQDIEDEQHAIWLKQLETGSRNRSGFQFVRSNRQSFIEQIKQLIDDLQANQSSTTKASNFLIDTHQKDQLFAFQLGTLLAEKEIKVDFNQESNDPIKSLENFEHAVKEVPNLIIMFGSVTPTWLKERIKTTIKIIANQLQTGSTTLDAIWVFMLPNCPGKEAVGEFPRLLKINYLDNSNSTSINEAVIDSLLNQASEQQS